MQVIEKRSSESRLYDLDCSLDLGSGESIQSVASVTAEPATTPPIVFGSAAVNAVPISYTDPNSGIARIAPIGSVIQINISGGKIAAGKQVTDYIVRAKFATNISPTVEATVRLKLNDTPST